jgi:hypothetical protein
MRAFVMFATPIMLTGCATLMEGTGQSVTISTDPAGAACTVDRAGTRLGQVNPTPGSLHIDKSKNDLQVACGKEGFSSSTVSESPKFVGTTFGNVLIGGLVGVAVDAASGANFEYPAEIKVSLAANGPVGVVSPQLPGTPASNGTARREFGIRGDVVTTSIASTVQLDSTHGVLVKSVENGGAASAAGLAAGDIILMFGGARIETVADMQTALAVVQPNSRVSAEIWRGRREVPITFNF